MKTTKLVLLLVLSRLISISQINSVDLRDSSLTVMGHTVYRHPEYPILTAYDIERNFGKEAVQKYKIANSIYEKKIYWHFLNNKGVAFEIPYKSPYIEYLRIFITGEELTGNKIMNQKNLFQDTLLFYGSIVTAQSTFAEIKKMSKIDSLENSKIGYLRSTYGLFQCDFYFSGHDDNSALSQIIIRIPNYNEKINLDRMLLKMQRKQ